MSEATVTTETPKPKRGRPKNPPPIVTMSPDQFQTILSALAQQREAAPEANRPELNAAIEAMKAMTEATNRTVLKDNASHPGISVFSYPEGEKAHPKPRLKFDEVFFGNVKQSWEQLTPTEVDLLNSFTSSTSAREGEWTAAVSRDGTKKRLIITFPCSTLEQTVGLPPMTAMLMELLHGPEIADPLKAYEHITQLQKQVAELQKQVAAQVVPA